MTDNDRSLNSNRNQNHPLEDSNSDCEQSSATNSLKAKSENINILLKTPLKTSTKDKQNVQSVRKDAQYEDNQGPSNNNNQISVIHPQQFHAVASSEEMLLKTLQESQNSLLKIASQPRVTSRAKTTTSRPESVVLRPRMSSHVFTSFIRQNFASDLTIQTDNSLLWKSSFNRELFRPIIDKATQFAAQDVSSYSETSSLDDVFSRHNPETTSQQVQITPSIVPPRPILGDPPLAGAPPSYSAVMRIGSTFNPRRFFGRRLGSQLEPSPPFISRSPPPTYAEAQGHYYRPIAVDSEIIWGPDPTPALCDRCGAYVITAVQSERSQNEIFDEIATLHRLYRRMHPTFFFPIDLIWGPEPTPAICQRCGIYVLTAIQSERSNLTHAAAVCLCLFGCWPCCLLPYCTDSCKNTYHYCPNCNTFLGMYRPW